MNLIECFQKNSYWYKNNPMGKKVIGVLWHDTAGGNPYIKRYVQPFETDVDYNEMIRLLGKNQYGNDWNHNGHKSGMNAWIGKLADGNIASVQTGEWERHPSGCGKGERGSCNGYTKNEEDGKMYYTDELFVNFEICDDGYKDISYFEAVYKEACELTAYLCDLFGIDPMGTVKYGGVEVPTILCHKDSCDLGLGNAHGDVYEWFEKFGKTMDDVRRDVQNIMKGYSVYYPETKLDTVISAIQKGDLIKIVGDSYYGGTKIPARILAKNWYVYAVSGDRVVINQSEDGLDEIMSPVNVVDITKVKVEETVSEPEKKEPENIPLPELAETNTTEGVSKEQESEEKLTNEKIVEEESVLKEAEESSIPDLKDIEDDDVYIHDAAEAKGFLIDLLNLIIGFMLKLFGKKENK